MFLENFGKKPLISENIFLKFGIILKEQYGIIGAIVVSLLCHTWFLEIAFVWEVGMCMCEHICPLGYILKTIHVKISHTVSYTSKLYSNS